MARRRESRLRTGVARVARIDRTRLQPAAVQPRELHKSLRAWALAASGSGSKGGFGAEAETPPRGVASCGEAISPFRPAAKSPADNKVAP